MPFAYDAATEETSNRFRTSQTDSTLLRTGRQAHDPGMLAMLKPHPWAGRRFHGENALKRKARFEVWFEHSRRWLLHYARLAETGGADVLEILDELAGLTVREQVWQSMIAEVRRVNPSPVTYAAHWETEIESVGFWDALD